MLEAWSQSVRTKSAIKVVAFVALLGSGCASRTYPGGGVLANRCIPMEADYRMSPGDELKIGVGDLSISQSNQGAEDYLALKAQPGGEVKVDFDPSNGKDDEHSPDIISRDSEHSEKMYTEKDGSVTVEVGKVSAGTLVVHIEKVCLVPVPQ